MFSRSLASFFLLPALLRVALAQSNSSSSSDACNNSPSLCSQSYGNITHLGAHDSPFLRDESTSFSTSGNQFFDTSTQLSAGVRLISAQVQRLNDTSGDLHVCHSSCDLLDAGLLSTWLREVKDWMDNNPNDVVTVLLVNGPEADATELASHYATAGITTDLAYTPSGATYESQQWPTLQELISSGTRLINFVSGMGDNAAAPYLMDEFDYVFENDYENTEPTDFSCEANRPGNAVGNTASVVSAGMLPLQNHFLYEDQAFGIMSPNQSYANITNAPGGGVGNLADATSTCTQAYGRPPTFVLVDFFNMGPAIETVDRLNGVTGAVGRATVSTDAQESGAASRYADPTRIAIGLAAAIAILTMV